MCKPAECPNCHKSSWIGCGLHIPQAMSAVSKQYWCTCAPADGQKSEFPPKAGTGIATDAKVSLTYDS